MTPLPWTLREAERLAFLATLLVFALVLAGVWS